MFSCFNCLLLPLFNGEFALLTEDAVPVSLGEGTSMVTEEQAMSVSHGEDMDATHVELAHMMPEGQVIHTTAVEMAEAVELGEGAVEMTEDDLTQGQSEFVTTSVEESMIPITE